MTSIFTPGKIVINKFPIYFLLQKDQVRCLKSYPSSRNWDSRRVVPKLQSKVENNSPNVDYQIKIHI